MFLGLAVGVGAGVGGRVTLNESETGYTTGILSYIRQTKVATITSEQIRKIAEQKMPDLNAASVEAAMSMIAGTARSMGVVVAD